VAEDLPNRDLSLDFLETWLTEKLARPNSEQQKVAA
jgi:hypothetical protein